MSRSPLGGYYRDIVVDGPQDGTEAHRALMEVAHEARRKEWTFGDFYETLSDPCSALGSTMKRRGGFHRRLQRTWAMAQETITRDRLEVRAQLAGYRHCADGTPWAWRGGSTDRLVYEGVLLTAEKRARFTITVSDRNLELLTTIKRRTVALSLKRLEERDLLTCLYTGEGRYASSWKIHRPKMRLISAHRSSDMCPETTHSSRSLGNASGYLPDTFEPTTSLQDYFETDAMAVFRAQHVLTLYRLSSSPVVSARELSRVVGISPSTASSTLSELAGYGLVENSPFGWGLSRLWREALENLADSQRGFRAAIDDRQRREREDYERARQRNRAKRLGHLIVVDSGMQIDASTGEVLDKPLQDSA